MYLWTIHWNGSTTTPSLGSIHFWARLPVIFSFFYALSHSVWHLLKWLVCQQSLRLWQYGKQSKMSYEEKHFSLSCSGCPCDQWSKAWVWVEGPGVPGSFCHIYDLWAYYFSSHTSVVFHNQNGNTIILSIGLRQDFLSLKYLYEIFVHITEYHS